MKKSELYDLVKQIDVDEVVFKSDSGLEWTIRDIIIDTTSNKAVVRIK